MAFLLAVFAGITSSYGQLTPRTLDCDITEGPLNPLLGKTYTYSVNVPNAATEFADGVTYRWVVTKDQTFITAGALDATVEDPAPTDPSGIFTHRGGSDYNDDGTGASSNTIDISWNSLPADANNPFFLIIKADGDNTVCTATNTKVYMIVPKNMFTLDLANVDQAGTVLDWDATSGVAVEAEECISEVQSVFWNPATTTATYDYGWDTLTYAVVAANWSDSWTPSLTISNSFAGDADNDPSLISSVTWSRSATYDAAAQDGSFTYNATDAEWQTTDDVTPATAGDVNVGTDGEVIYIHVIVDHTNIDATNGDTFNEGLVDQTFTLAIDGVTANGDGDVHYTDSAGGDTDALADCGDVDGYENDLAAQTIKKRPGIDTNTVDDDSNTQDLLTPVITAP